MRDAWDYIKLAEEDAADTNWPRAQTHALISIASSLDRIADVMDEERKTTGIVDVVTAGLDDLQDQP
jgi:hypothetical protein